MKNLSLGLNAVLLVAVAFLYYLHFKGNNATSDSSISSGKMPVSSQGIVYITEIPGAIQVDRCIKTGIRTW